MGVAGGGSRREAPHYAQGHRFVKGCGGGLMAPLAND